MNPLVNVAVIPARAGSKRLPGKNIARLQGKPLIAWSIEAALESGCFTEILISTDSLEVKEIAECFQDTVRVCLRPADLADDNTLIQDVLNFLLHSERWLERGMERLCLLQPTSPLRKAAHIRESMDLLLPEWESVIGVCEYEFPPQLCLSLRNSDGAATAAWDNSPLENGGRIRTQDLPTLFRPNGAVYWTWLKAFANNRSFYSGKIRGYPMPWENSIDIDTQKELELAAYLLQRHSPAG